MRQEIVANNPAANLHAPKGAKNLPVFIDQDKMNLLFDKVHFENNFAGQRDKLILELLYTTGMRRSELIHLSWLSIDFDTSRIKILGKGGKERILPLSNFVKEQLKAYLNLLTKTFPNQTKPTAQVFVTNKGQALYPKFLYRLVKKYLSAITTNSKRSPHVLRHSFATNLLNNGADLHVVKELLGHASLASTQIYTSNTIEKMKQAYQQAHPKGK